MTLPLDHLETLAREATRAWRATVSEIHEGAEGDAYGFAAFGPTHDYEGDEDRYEAAQDEAEADARYIAAASPDVVLALLDRLERVEAQEAVRGGEWCAQNRAEGRGPCGACAWCCKQASDDAERLRLAVAAYLKARDTWGYTMGAINAEARAADALRAALRGEP